MTARPATARPATAGPVTARAVTGAVLRAGPVSVRLHPRAATAVAGLLLSLAGVAAAALATGDYPLALADVARSLVGAGNPGTDFVVWELRLPRLAAGIAVGAGLGLSGALLQGLSRNALASPDLVGFTSGAATGAIAAFAAGASSLLLVGMGALAGGAAACVLVYALARRRGQTGDRLILVGIGVTAALTSVNAYLITRAPLHDAVAAQSWLVGGLNHRGWPHVAVAGLTVAALGGPAVVLGRRLAATDLGDTAAAALGVRVEQTRRLLLGIAVALAGAATAAAGPVAFVALAAPHLARRLTGPDRPGLVGAAVMGAVLLAASDLATQRLFTPTPLPVGVVTAGLGGLYLIWLLGSQWRRRG